MLTDSNARFEGYEIINRLGDGASGIVYRARQLSTQQLVAIKVLHAEAGKLASSARLRARFDRETQICAGLHHPHIVRLLDKGETTEGQAFAVFEYIPGETLHQILLKEGALPAPEAGELMGQVLDALVAAHAAGIVHRDLKPQNIMVSRSGSRRQAKVLDFGIGTFTTETGQPTPQNFTMTSESIGTPLYSAPEQLRGEPPTVKSDIYSWALILLECLTGSPAVDGKTLAQVYHAHLSSAEVSMPNALLRHPLGALLRRALSKQASRRARSASELLEQFGALQFGNLVGVLEPSNGTSLGSSEASTQWLTNPLVERRQITMLSYTLAINSASGDADPEAIESILAEKLQACDDACVTWGACAAGSRGSGRLMYFGYPQGSDQASRSAGRAALDLLNRVNSWKDELAQTGVRLTLRGALHTGTFLVRAGTLPTGRAAAEAVNLENLARSGEILVGPLASELLERSFELRPHLGAPSELAGVAQLVSEKDCDSLNLSKTALESAALMGRSDELAALNKAWASCLSESSGTALLLIGEAGIGKSRLAQEACNVARVSRGHVWPLRCTPEQQNTALFPFLTWLRSLFTFELHLTRAVAVEPLMAALDRAGFDSRDVGPLLCSWLGLPIPAGLSPACHAPQRQLQTVLAVLRALIQPQPGETALLVLEDIHWLDPTSRAFLDALLEQGLPRGLMLLMTTRPDSGYRPKALELHLAGLPRSDAEALLLRLMPSTGLSPAEAAQLALRGDGNPLYLTELARAYAAQPAASEPRRSGVDANVPASLRDLLSHALDRIGPAKNTSQCAAAQGREFSLAVLLETAETEADVVHSHLEQMELAGLVSADPSSGRQAFSFRHALLRDAAYESIAQGLKEQVHLRIGRALESRPDVGSEVLALHYAAAHSFELAVTHGIKGAASSLSRGLQEESLERIDQIRHWLSKLTAADKRPLEIDLERIATQCLMSKYGWADPKVKAAAERSDLLIRGTDDSERGGAALWALATYHHVASDRARVRALVEQLHTLAGASNSVALTRAAYTMQGMACWIDGTFEEAAKCFEEVLAGPGATGEQDAALFGLDCRCWSMAALANVRWFLDDQAGAIALSVRAIEEAEELNHIPTLGLCLMYASFLCQHAGDRAGATRICERLTALSRRFGLPAVEAYCTIIDAWARADRQTVAGVLAGLRAFGCNLGQTYFGAVLAELAADAGDTEEALRVIDETLKQATEIDEHYFVPELWLLRARCNIQLENERGAQNERGIQNARDALSQVFSHAPTNYTKRRAALLKQTLSEVTAQSRLTSTILQAAKIPEQQESQL